MNPLEITLGVALALVLVGLAGFFFLHQKATLHELRTRSDFSPEDRNYLYKQIYRRSLGCVLMVVLAALLIGWFFVGANFDELGNAAGKGDEMSEEVKDQIRFFAMYWIFALLVFLALAILAVFDWLATARFGHRNRKQLEKDRKAALAADAARLRHPPAEWN